MPIGSGIAGRAAADRTVCLTGDYLADESFPHDEGDARIRDQGIRSMMSAPLIGPDRLDRHHHRPVVGAERVRRGGRDPPEAPRRPGGDRGHERAPVRGAGGVGAPLPAPRRQLARHRVEHRRRGAVHVLLRLARVADGLEAGAAARPALHDPDRCRRPCRRTPGLGGAPRQPGGRAARPPHPATRERPDLGGRGGDDRHRRGRPLRRRPRGGARHRRAGAPRALAPPPGRRARRGPRARQPRARAPRLGDAGAVQHGPHDPLARAAAGSGSRGGSIEARRAARPPARCAGRDADAHLRAPPLVARVRRPAPGGAHPRCRRPGPHRHERRGRLPSPTRSRRAASRARRSGWRRRSTASRRRRSTTS